MDFGPPFGVLKSIHLYAKKHPKRGVFWRPPLSAVRQTEETVRHFRYPLQKGRESPKTKEGAARPKGPPGPFSPSKPPQRGLSGHPASGPKTSSVFGPAALKVGEPIGFGRFDTFAKTDPFFSSCYLCRKPIRDHQKASSPSDGPFRPTVQTPQNSKRALLGHFQEITLLRGLTFTKMGVPANPPNSVLAIRKGFLGPGNESRVWFGPPGS